MIKPDPSKALRGIPSLDAFLRRGKLTEVPRSLASREARSYLDDIRSQVLAGRLGEDDVAALFSATGVGTGEVTGERTGEETGAERAVLERCEQAKKVHHCRVINATGIVLHTGIGRAPLPPAAVQAIVQATGYAIVEIDPSSGQRNERETKISRLLQEILGVEAGLVVNNNAAATTVMLAGLASGKEVVTSRGELVEIGGGFRVPDVMRQAGCILVEVGATNRTHLEDFAAAIGPATAMLLKVHTSNYRLVGFHKVPELSELATLARSRDVLSAEDLGSGLICDADLPALVNEPRVQTSLATGVDVVCFSGDKLLGGPQCGIIVGRKDVVARVRAHPLYRATRCDKLTLAALEATLRIYRDGDPLEEIPVLRALTRSREQLASRASELCAQLSVDGARVVESESFAGSGANPAHPIDSMAIAIPGGDRICGALRNGPGTPIISRIENEQVLLDLRTLDGEDLAFVADQVNMKLLPPEAQAPARQHG